MENILSQYVVTFLDNNKKTSSRHLVEQWNSEQTQASLKSLVSTFAVVPDSSKKEKKERKQKDPNAPKRGKSSYLIFCNELREEVRKQNPHLNAKEITSELGKQWNTLKQKNPSKVAEYEKIASSDRERYHSEKKSYTPAGVDGQEPPKPKIPRAKSGYIVFCTAERLVIKEENPGMSAKDITSELAKRWNYLKANNPDKIKKFEQLAAQTNASTASTTPVVAPVVVEAKPAEEQKKEETDPFDNFCKEKRKKVQKENPDLTAKDISKKLKKLWKGLSDEEKEKYA